GELVLAQEATNAPAQRTITADKIWRNANLPAMNSAKRGGPQHASPGTLTKCCRGEIVPLPIPGGGGRALRQCAELLLWTGVNTCDAIHLRGKIGSPLMVFPRRFRRSRPAPDWRRRVRTWRWPACRCGWSIAGSRGGFPRS